MGLLSIGGIGSGLDVNSIIEALVNAEKAPKAESLNRLESQSNLKLSGLGRLNTVLDELKTSIETLADADSFNNRTASVTSDEEFLSATTGSTATPGSFEIHVTSLAKATEIESQIFTGGSSTTFGDGTLTFTAGGETFDVAVTATDTLEDIRDNINTAADNIGVSVNLLNNVTDGTDTGSVLTIDSSITGASNNLTVTSADPGLAGFIAALSQTQPASDASITVDGFTATSNTNTFADVIQDVTLTVNKEHAVGENDTLTVALDKDATKELLTNFVDAYNSYASAVNALGASNPDAPGDLAGDYTLRQVSSNIRSLISQPITGGVIDFDTLSSIGITTTVDGQLEISDSTLDNVLDNNFDVLEPLFSGADGYASQLENVITRFTESNGILDDRETSLNAQLRRVEDERISLDYRISLLETRLIKQFGAMDALVAQLNNTGSFIAQQFANLPKANDN